MQFLPGETLGTLGQFLTLKDILALATSNSDFQKNFLKPDINTRLADHFGFPYGLSLVELKKYKEMRLQERLDVAAKTGDLRVAKKVIELYEQDPFEILSGLDVVTGQILQFRSKTTLNFNMPLHDASSTGHIEIVKYLIEKGADDFSYAMRRAIVNGHVKVVKYLIEKAGKEKNILDEGLTVAANEGKSEIVDLLIQHGANNLNEALRFATLGNHEEIVEKLIRYGANDFNEMIFAAIQTNNEKLLYRFLELAGDNIRNNMDILYKSIEYAIRKDKEKLFYRFYELAGDINDASILYEILGYVIRKDNAELSDQIGQKLYHLGMYIDPNQILLKAAENGSIKVAEKMIENRAGDLYQAYNIAKRKGYDKFAERIEEIHKSLNR